MATTETTSTTTAAAAAAKSPEQPRRNLTEAFERLCVVSPEETVKEEKTNDSPTTAITDFFDIPDLQLHPDLRGELSVSCVTRVSCYSIIHDINKEAVALAAHDPLAGSLEIEKKSPLVLTAQEQDPISELADNVDHALIDEEKWLLHAIQNRTDSSSASSTCPATFLQAMGEKEYENNTIQSVTGSSRTQLWKPSRSWWEAKSGKNPWIEPASHNKRWRYLWPLIHYHKFLAKCIKKLKRNGVDVKQSLSPVSVFLRDEVCAVSDHLASVSLFDSDEWMDCLQHFHGWTREDSEEHYRAFVASLPLRPLQEQGDVDSPVLRNQIDETFLRTMAAQREQLHDPSHCNSSPKDTAASTTTTVAATATPPNYSTESPQVPKQINGVRRPRYYPNSWYGWGEPNYHDANSVHSELSANSFPQPVPHALPYPMYPPVPPMGYFHPPPPPQVSDHSDSTGAYHYPPEQYAGWMDMAYAMQHHYYGQMHSPYHHPHVEQQTVPEELEEGNVAEQTPFKYDPENSMTMSPYWNHLFQPAPSPAKVTPCTPRRAKSSNNKSAFAMAQAPLLRNYTNNNTVPPSPATRFLMASATPQPQFQSPRKSPSTVDTAEETTETTTATA